MLLLARRPAQTSFSNGVKQFQKGSLTAITAGEDVVPASELAAAIKQIRELQRLLGKKTMENEILKEAVEYGRAKKWIAHAPLLLGTTIKCCEPGS